MSVVVRDKIMKEGVFMLKVKVFSSSSDERKIKFIFLFPWCSKRSAKM